MEWIETVCGPVHERQLSAMVWLNESTNELCTCGGGSPSDGCDACRLYHAALRLLDRPEGWTNAA